MTREEEKFTPAQYERATLDEALYDAREYLVAGPENQAEWWEHLGDAHRDYAALAQLADVQEKEIRRLRDALSRVYQFGRGLHVEIAREALNG